MEIPNKEEVAILTETIGAFYKGLIANGIPSELACQLTGGYFSAWLSWDDDDDDDDDEVPSPMWPPGTKFYSVAGYPYISE